MKRAVRWLGFAIVAAAAATMLMADMVLARPATLAQTAMQQSAGQTTHQTAGQTAPPVAVQVQLTLVRLVGSVSVTTVPPISIRPHARVWMRCWTRGANPV